MPSACARCATPAAPCSMTCGQIELERTALPYYTAITWGAEFVLQNHMFCWSGFSRLRKCPAEDAPGKGCRRPAVHEVFEWKGAEPGVVFEPAPIVLRFQEYRDGSALLFFWSGDGGRPGHVDVAEQVLGHLAPFAPGQRRLVPHPVGEDRHATQF